MMYVNVHVIHRHTTNEYIADLSVTANINVKNLPV